MKYRSFMIVPLAAALMLPAMAQQSSSPNNANPPAAAQTDQSQNGAPDQVLQPLEPERHEGFWGKVNPFARKKYVQRQLEPIRGRVNELDELTAANSKAIRDVDSRAQEGIRMASAKADQADQHAVEAGSRAQQANQVATQASTRLNTVEQVVGNLDSYHPVTEAEIRLKPGQAVLSKKAKDALDELAKSVEGQKGYIIQVQGFSSGRGQSAIQNSQHMAQSVVRYLVLNHEIPVYRIYLLGLGNTPRPAADGSTKAKPITGGTVEVSLLKNDLDQLSAAGNTGAADSGAQGGASGMSTQPQPPAADTNQSQQNQSPATNLNQEPQN